MVTIIAAHKREKEDGKTFISLELQGDIVMIQSSNTGRFYATAKRCFIFSTFDEATANRLVGSQMPGRIDKVECQPYDFTIPETAEVIQLSHTYTYFPENAPSSVTQPNMAYAN